MINETHIHKKTGNHYQLLYISNLHSNRDDFVPTAIYKDQSGKLWSRTLLEFNDKFDRISYETFPDD